jgi:predicted NBD/HSP70 family sugar kinase
LIDLASGTVRSAVNLDWQDLPLRSLLHERYGLPVYVANDCQAAALAEHTFGDGKDAESLVVVKVDQGVGDGSVLHGRVFYGDLCSAGEIGHIAVVENGQRCRCGNLGCLETVAGERAIIQQAQAIARSDPHSSLHRFAVAPDQITIEAICRVAEAGDQAVRQLVADAGRYLGFAVANLVGVLGVRRIMIAGHVTCFGQPWLDAIRQELSRRSLATVTGEVAVEISEIGRDIVILGASAMVLINELGLLAPVVNGINA